MLLTKEWAEACLAKTVQTGWKKRVPIPGLNSLAQLGSQVQKLVTWWLFNAVDAALLQATGTNTQTDTHTNRQTRWVVTDVLNRPCGQISEKPGAALQTPLWFIHSLTDWLRDPFVKISLQRRNALIAEDCAFSHKIHYVTTFVGDYKSRRASKSHHWFKSYGDFTEWVGFPVGGVA